MDKKNITGLRIKNLRNNANLTQKELAHILELSSDSTIVSYEKGISFPSHKVIYKLADYFKVTVDYLLGNDTDIEKVRFANSGGLDVDGLDKNDIDEIKRQIEYMKWKKTQGNK